MQRAHVLVPFRNPAKVQPYLEALRQAGIEALPHLTERSTRLNGAAGLLLTGGTDVNPKLYGEAAVAETDAPDDERDSIELELLNGAIEKDLPVLAICRGHQLLNVYFGGTLIQHLGSLAHDPNFEDRAKPAHEISIEKGSLLRGALEVDRLAVNSRHHQAIKKVGAGLHVTARGADDGTIEALEHPGKRFVVAVQWHPEDQVSSQPEQIRLFKHFAKAL